MKSALSSYRPIPAKPHAEYLRNVGKNEKKQKRKIHDGQTCGSRRAGDAVRIDVGRTRQRRSSHRRVSLRQGRTDLALDQLHFDLAVRQSARRLLFTVRSGLLVS
jgi:hypothetical protein